jgi:hypothetical protein
LPSHEVYKSLNIPKTLPLRTRKQKKNKETTIESEIMHEIRKYKKNYKTVKIRAMRRDF